MFTEEQTQTDDLSEALPQLNGHANGVHNGKTVANGTVAPSTDPPRQQNGYAVPSTNGTALPDSVPDPQIQRQPDFANAPTPEESTVVDEPIRGRSLRLQLRFVRTLVFAAWLFVRLIFWQIYVYKVAPNYIERTNMKRWQKYAREFSGFAVKLGGVFIKMGQFISTRVDILPEEILKELENLQDEVPTIKFKKIRTTLEQELGDLNQHFSYFDESPVAAASLGQAHRARLLDGDKVVVKVQRPGIRNVCYTDLAAMRIIARVAMRFNFISRRANASALVEEFGRVFLEELSYKHEAYNATRFSEMYKDDLGVYIPIIYYEHSTDRVLTIEDVTSIKITDFAAMEAAGISRKAVAKRMMDTYLPQVFNHYYFHADPHPGNLFVYPLPVEDENADFGEEGRPFYLIFIDFGMVGSLTREIADGMVSTLSAVLTRDPRKLIQSYVRLGFILPGADISRIEEAARAAFDQVWGMNMTDMRDVDFKQMEDLANEFSDLIFDMPFYIPQDFLYLGRTISILSGMTTSLDPDFNPWNELQPYTEILIARGFGINVDDSTKRLTLGNAVGGLLRGQGTNVLREFGGQLLQNPVTRADRVLQRVEDGDIQVTTNLSIAHRQQLRKIEKESKRTGRSVFFGSLLVSSTLLYTNGDTTLATIGFVVTGLTLVIGFFKDV